MPTIPYSKQGWTDGVSALSAARMLVLENGIYEVSLAPSVHVYNSGTQSITSANETVLSFNSEICDQVAGAASTMHDNSTNNSRLTCLYAGRYDVFANIDFAANATGQRFVGFRVNGTGSQYLALDRKLGGSGSYTTTLMVTAQLTLAVNDYVQVVVYQDSGGALNVNAASTTVPFNCQFGMTRIA